MNTKEKIMSRVCFIYWCRRINASPWVKIGVAGTMTSLAMVLVSVASVWQNSPTLLAPHQVVGYFWMSFWQTDAITQMLTIAIVMTLLWLARDIARLFRSFLMLGRHLRRLPSFRLRF